MLFFTFQLARDLGKSVSELMGSMSSQELTYWMAFYTLNDKRQQKQIEAAQRKHKSNRKRPLKG